MRNCVLKLVRGWHPNPDGIPYMGHLCFPTQLLSIVFIGNPRLTQAKMTLFTVWVRVNYFLLTPSLSVISSVCVASFTRWLVCHLPHQHPTIVSKQTKLYIFLFFCNYKWYLFPFHTFPRFNFSDIESQQKHIRNHSLRKEKI
jgi:hypothetical protein